VTSDVNHPVIVGAHEIAVRTADAEPIAMMARSAREALAETEDVLRQTIETIRVVKGIWPYEDPGALVANELGLSGVTTAVTRIGGNATYDLVNRTAVDIASGAIRTAIVCGAESMRTRRKDRAAGTKSHYLSEPDGVVPDFILGPDVDLIDDADIGADVFHPVNFYAMTESVIRHRRGESPEDHLTRISELWARGSAVASKNPNAWLAEMTSAEEIATPTQRNRMIAAPYTKLLTSNIDVDQGAAIVMCAYGVAHAAGIADDQMVFLLSGSGALDTPTIRRRQDLDRSPAFAHAADRALTLAATNIDAIDHLDLYSCFPASVQLAQVELGIDPDREFTITGGLTFAGGPYNGYCTQTIAHATHLLRGSGKVAFLYGNGGFFSKHAVVIASGEPPQRPYSYERPQNLVDDSPSRPLASTTPSDATVEAYTVTYDRESNPTRGILAVLDSDGCRHWALCRDRSMIEALLASDHVGRRVILAPPDRESTSASPRPAPLAQLLD
jgi:acetyl-CoA C-acetyltransferase